MSAPGQGFPRRKSDAAEAPSVREPERLAGGPSGIEGPARVTSSVRPVALRGRSAFQSCHSLAVLLPESFRGGCSFGADGFYRRSLPRGFSGTPEDGRGQRQSQSPVRQNCTVIVAAPHPAPTGAAASCYLARHGRTHVRNGWVI